MLILGVDPGVNGALCWVEYPQKEVLKISRFPVIPVPGNSVEKNRLDIQELIILLGTSLAPNQIVLEYPNIIGGNMPIAQVLFFCTLGKIEACLTGLAPITRVNPLEWKKPYNLIKKSKGESTKTAKQIFNGLVINNADIAEACLMTHWFFNYYTGEK